MCLFPKERQFSTVKVLEFIRRKLPYRMVDTVTDRSVLDFISGWRDNRVRVLIFGHVSAPNSLFRPFIKILLSLKYFNMFSERYHPTAVPRHRLQVP